MQNEFYISRKNEEQNPHKNPIITATLGIGRRYSSQSAEKQYLKPCVNGVASETVVAIEK